MPTANRHATKNGVLKTDDLRTWIRMRGWTDHEMAQAMGVSDAFFSRVMSGIRRPGIKFIHGVLRATQCPFATFFEA